MPFDVADFSIETKSKHAEEIAILDEMITFFAVPENWCTRSFSRGAARCLLGKLNEIDHGDPQPGPLDGRFCKMQTALGESVALRLSANLSSRYCGSAPGIWMFNDDMGHVQYVRGLLQTTKQSFLKE